MDLYACGILAPQPIATGDCTLHSTSGPRHVARTISMHVCRCNYIGCIVDPMRNLTANVLAALKSLLLHWLHGGCGRNAKGETHCSIVPKHFCRSLSDTCICEMQGPVQGTGGQKVFAWPQSKWARQNCT